MATSGNLLEALAERVLLYDGATGTQVQAAELAPTDFVLPADSSLPRVRAAAARLEGKPLDGCTDILCLTRPDAVEAIHASYLAAGSDLIETNTFGATSIVLGEYGVPELVRETTFAAAQIARRAADRFASDKPRFVVGALGPGTKLVSLGQTTWEELEATYADGFAGLLEGGADALLLETLQDLLMAKAGIVAARIAMEATGREVPLFVQATMEQTGTMLLGSELGAALAMVEAFPHVAAFGLNCATGPAEMTPHVRFLCQNSTRPISVQPNAGLPQMEAGRAVYKLGPEEFARRHVAFVDEFGAAMVGGCCGTTPEHIRAAAAALGGATHRAPAHWLAARGAFPGFDFHMRGPEQDRAVKLVGCASLYQFVPYAQDSSVLIVGEKTNANGSKAFRDLLDADDWEGLTELAREVEAEGSHLLDVCAAFVGRDEVRDLRMLLSFYNRHVAAPIMLDSTEPPAIEAGLRALAGKPVVNSINFEDGGKRVEQVLSLCRAYGAGVVALTIDEDGMAKTAEKKVEIAERLLAAAREYGLPEHDVFLDPLTFTLGSGDEEFRAAGRETLDALREIRRRHPAANTLLGVSNISFGLKPALRRVVNSAFLRFAEQAGLTGAIVHIGKIVPESGIEPEIWTLAEDLIFDRRRFSA